jgi:4-alpha-glucanotransferase
MKTLTIPRSCGILLHPTSLPGPHGMGELGASAHAFIVQLARANQSWWQMLPVNTPGYAGSPYSAESAFAGNPMLIDSEALFERGLVTSASLDALARIAHTTSSTRRVDFGPLIAAKYALLHEAAKTLLGGQHDTSAYDTFREEHAHWLDDFTLYAALKQEHGGAGWRSWSTDLVRRTPGALRAARQRLATSIAHHMVYQYLFFEQWDALRATAHAHGVKLIGDVPIFVAMDSADVWVNRDLFKLSEEGHAEVVAGVPPDYFSKTGQKWGNPVYDWDAVARDDYAWWIARIKHSMAMMDLVRIDHFRGFAAYWETPESEPTAMHGKWVQGPGHAFFDAIKDALGTVPFIAEDLGDIDAPVHALRDDYDLPGMKIMHFAFGDDDPDHIFRPHTYPELCVAYTGTHDNDTTRGWYEALSPHEKHRVRTYFKSSDEAIVDHMIAHLLKSKAALTILPAQDLWELDSTHRMNTPATAEGNWGWRMTQAELDDDARFEELGELVALTQRQAES